MKVRIDKLVYGGLGFGRVNGKAVFVPFSAPGDLLEVKIVKKKKGYEEGVARKILEASKCRVQPACPYYGACGGCHLQHINYAEQLIWKGLILEEQIKRIAKIENAEVLPALPSPKIWEYRNKIQVQKKGRRLGLFEMGSNDIVEIKECPITEPEVVGQIEKIRENKRLKDGRYEISMNEGEGFSQANSCLNEELKKVVVEWVKEVGPENILELYAGNGNFTFDLARIANKVIAVEKDKRSAGLARTKIQKEEIKNITFLNHSTEKALTSLRAKRSNTGDSFGLPEPFGLRDDRLVLTDPPREGMGKEIVRKITKLEPKTVIYISCDPSTLARDIKEFCESGYHLVKTQPVDMFPQTYHIESISLLRQAS